MMCDLPRALPSASSGPVFRFFLPLATSQIQHRLSPSKITEWTPYSICIFGNGRQDTCFIYR
jgi:hypothetical protein